MVNIEVEAFKNYVDRREIFYKRIQNLIGDQQYIDLDYVDIVNETDKFRNIIPFLGIRNQMELRALTRKQNLSRLKDRISNYDFIAQYLSKTKYEKYLEEELD